MHVAIRINGPRPLRHYFDLRFAYFSIQCVQLAVHIADANFVQIDESEFADAAPRERLRRPRANSTDADHAYMRAAQTLQTIRSVEALDAVESLIEVAHRKIICMSEISCVLTN